MAALWTEICLAFPAIHALGEGYEVYIVTDASGSVSVEAHEMAIQRMVQAGAVPSPGRCLRRSCSAIGLGRKLYPLSCKCWSSTWETSAPALPGSSSYSLPRLRLKSTSRAKRTSENYRKNSSANLGILNCLPIRRCWL